MSVDWARSESYFYSGLRGLMCKGVLFYGGRAKTKPGIAGSAVSRAAFLRERWAIIKQVSGLNP